MIGKKIIISGVSGMLGSSLLAFLKGNTIVGIDRKLDVTNSFQIQELIEKEKPEIIIHTAAITNVDSCEKDIDDAYKVNVIGTQNLVNGCIDKNILFIYVSSTGVYGEYKNGTYTEFDKVEPTTIHHKTKLEGENVVKNHLSKYLILRTGWLYGGDKEQKKNFVYKRYLESIQNKIMYSDNSQIGNPTSVLDFCNQIRVLIEKNQYGVFNCINKAENISRFDYVSQIIKEFETDCQVRIASTDAYTRSAKVSKNESAKNYKLDLLGLNIMRDWDVALKEYVLKLKNEDVK